MAALLHDLGRIKLKKNQEHHITGITKAEKILKRYGYSEEVIKEVKHCVESHRTSKGPKSHTMIAKIIANADAMSHFDVLPVFFYWRSKKYTLIELLNWADNKIKNDWKRKITLPEAKKMSEKKYKATRLLLDSLKEYMK